MDTTTATPATTSAPAAQANGKPERKKLPKVQKVFATKAELDKGQEVAKKAGHTYDTRKFKVTSQDGKTTKYVLAFSPANAGSQVVEDMGLNIEELDAAERTPFQPTKATAEKVLAKLSQADRDAILAELTASKKAKK